MSTEYSISRKYSPVASVKRVEQNRGNCILTDLDTDASVSDGTFFELLVEGVNNVLAIVVGGTACHQGEKQGTLGADQRVVACGTLRRWREK